MLEVIEKLLILQDCDRNIMRTQSELNTIAPQRAQLLQKLETTQTGLQAAQHRLKALESNRKELELEVESHQEQISRYSNQQMQTKKNEEYQALGREITAARKAISSLEDRQLDLMEQIETGQNEVRRAGEEAARLKADAELEIQELDAREANLKDRLTELNQRHDELTGPVDPDTLTRYQRIQAKKGEKVVVGIERGICGGCHMKLPAQELVLCQREQAIVSCPNCGRILYYTRDMVLTAEIE